MSPLTIPLVALVTSAFLTTAAADTVTSVPANPGGAILMPLVGVPDSQVYVYPMTASPSVSAEAAGERIRSFAALFHAADPRIQQEFAEQWAKVQKRWSLPSTAASSERPVGAK